MKRILLTALAGTFLIAACNNEKKKDEEKKDKSSESTGKMDEKTNVMPDSATMMKNWMAYSTPGKEQEMLAKSNGNWTAEISMWEQPGAPEQKSTGTVENKMIMGGRYQLANHSATMMGQPFEGMSVTGYDNAKKVFMSTWIDNMGTGIYTMEGTWDDASKSMTMKGKMMDPATYQDKEMREVFTLVDDDHQTFEMFAPGPDGKEFRNMIIKYTRKK